MSDDRDGQPRLIFGLQPVREALRVLGPKLMAVYVEEAAGPALDAVARFATDRGAPLRRVPRSTLDRMAAGGRHQGVAAEAPELRRWRLDELDLGPQASVVLLDGITDPHNFGATVRSAVALGSGEVVFGSHGAAPLTPATFRASAGAVEHARLVRVPSLHGAVESLVTRGLCVVGLDGNAPRVLSDVRLDGPVGLVVGAEDHGIARAVKRACSAVARLPMSAAVGSLNASVAAAVALYEVRRQRLSATAPDPPPPRLDGEAVGPHER